MLSARAADPTRDLSITSDVYDYVLDKLYIGLHLFPPKYASCQVLNIHRVRRSAVERILKSEKTESLD